MTGAEEAICQRKDAKLQGREESHIDEGKLTLRCRG
jgi:hypothetical protein